MKKSKDDDKEFEKKIFTVLKAMKITPRGYYTYPDSADLVGYQEPEWPYTIPSKVVVEFSFGKLSAEKIESFDKVIKDSKAVKGLIFGQEDYKRLGKSLQSALRLRAIEYFGPNDVGGLLEKKKVTVSEKSVQEYRKAIKIVAADRLVESLSELALQKIPGDMKTALETANPGANIPAWDVFEDAVCASFRSCLGYKVKQMGKEMLFDHEPEGVGTVRKNHANKYGFLYECKSAKENYHMTAQDMLTYIDYIQNKKQEVNATEGVDLRYFVLVGPSFSGDKENRRNEIYGKTGVLVVYLKASVLKMLAQWACAINDPDIKGLIDMTDILNKINDVEVQEATVKDYITNFDKKYKERY